MEVNAFILGVFMAVAVVSAVYGAVQNRKRKALVDRLGLLHDGATFPTALRFEDRFLLLLDEQRVSRDVVDMISSPGSDPRLSWFTDLSVVQGNEGSHKSRQTVAWARSDRLDLPRFVVKHRRAEYPPVVKATEVQFPEPDDWRFKQEFEVLSREPPEKIASLWSSKIRDFFLRLEGRPVLEVGSREFVFTLGRDLSSDDLALFMEQTRQIFDLLLAAQPHPLE